MVLFGTPVVIWLMWTLLAVLLFGPVAAVVYIHLKYHRINPAFPLGYRLRHWLFRWGRDEDNDIVLSVAGTVHFIKYKEHTLVKFGRRKYGPAPKWVELHQEDDCGKSTP